MRKEVGWQNGRIIIIKKTATNYTKVFLIFLFLLIFISRNLVGSYSKTLILREFVINCVRA